MKYVVFKSPRNVGIAYKIYIVENNKIVSPVAGVYWALHKGKSVNTNDPWSNNVFDTYEGAKKFVMRDAILSLFNGNKIYSYEKLAKSLLKGEVL